MQIQEPIIKNKKENEVISIGIDFGTTNCVASFVRNKIVTTIEDSGNDIIPSCVAINNKNGTIIIGRKAFELKENKDYTIISSIKRSIEKQDFIKIKDKDYKVGEICSLIINHIKNLAENQLKTKINECVITVPAYFNDIQRNIVKSAAIKSGFEVKRIINEPTAAALAYGLENEKEGKYLVYDLGGGTFDASILEMQKGIFKVISTKGDMELGGDDFDNEIINILKEKNILINQKKAREIKEFLSENISFNENEISITRREFNKRCNFLIKKTTILITEILEESKIKHSELNGIILVGGSTKMKLIKNELKKIFDIKILTDLDPDKIVGIGAGIKAAGKKSGFENILLDVIPLSLGIETFGGIFEKIIFRNSTIPCFQEQDFTTSHDNQTGIILNILQGEREMAKDCRSLGKFLLKEIPKMPAGMPKIKIKFSVDADSILSVSAIEENSNKKIEIEVKPTYGIDYKGMSEMIINAIQYAKEDMEEKLLTEETESAKNLVLRIQKAIKEDWKLLTEEELNLIDKKISELENLYNMKNIENLEKSKKELEEIVLPFFEERVNKELRKALKDNVVF